MKYLSILFTFLAFAWTSPAQATREYLVRDGQPEAQIVVANDPARKTRLAAKELQSILERISGARLPITSDPDPKKATIYVGVSQETKRLGLTTEGLAHGAFRMESGDGWIALFGPDYDFVPKEPFIRSRTEPEFTRVHREWDAITGDQFHTPLMSLFGEYHKNLQISEHDDGGTLNAVYEYLRSLGARWYFPGELGEVLPSLKTIPLPELHRTVKPDFALRKLSYFHSRNGMSEDELLWNLRMGTNYGQELIGLIQTGHGMKFVTMREEFKKAHPDYFVLRNGSRATHGKHPGSGCLSSPGLFEKHVKFVRAVFNQYDLPMVSIDLPDSYGTLCEDPSCHPQGTPERGFQGRMSDYVWSYMNKVAWEIHQSHPERKVLGLAYSGYELPPLKIDRFPPNLAMMECRWRSKLHNEKLREYYRELRTEWLKKLPSKEWYIHDYYLHARPGSASAGMPAYFPHIIAEDLRSLKGVSSGENIEVFRHPHHLKQDFDWHDFAISHLNLYVTSRFWWDSSQDINELLEEFYDRFYGPAQSQMKELIEYSEANWHLMRKDGAKIDHLFGLLAEAQKAAPTDTPYEKRIALVADFIAQLKPLRERLERGREGPVVQIPERATAGVPLDANGDKAFWADVPAYDLKLLRSGDEPVQPTRVKLAWGDNESLYLLIQSHDSKISEVDERASRNDDTAMWDGDFVELLLETATHSYYQIAVSPSGHLLDVDRSGGGQIDTLWSSAAKVATRRDATSWSVEIQIPAAGDTAAELYPSEGVSGDRPTARAPWYFNIGRKTKKSTGDELSAISPTGNSKFHDALKFGRLEVH